MSSKNRSRRSSAGHRDLVREAPVPKLIWDRLASKEPGPANPFLLLTFHRKTPGFSSGAAEIRIPGLPCKAAP
jgi:hypothetical protein